MGGVELRFVPASYVVILCFVLSVYIIGVLESRRMRLALHVARMGDRLGAYGVFVGRPEGKRSHRKYKPRCQDGIEMHLQEVGWVGMERIDLAQDRDRWRALVNVIMNLLVP
jgi:hypothetical protein